MVDDVGDGGGGGGAMAPRVWLEISDWSGALLFERYRPRDEEGSTL